MIGIPGSGKSTEAEHLMRNARNMGFFIEYISADKIREELYGDASVQGDGGKVFSIFYSRLNSSIEGKPDQTWIFIDNTSVSRKARKDIFKILIDNQPKVGLVEVVEMHTPVEICIDRQTKRDRKVPEDVIRRMHSNFRSFERDELDGFAGIISRKINEI